jgi:hypothetical protein
MKGPLIRLGAAALVLLVGRFLLAHHGEKMLQKNPVTVEVHLMEGLAQQVEKELQQDSDNPVHVRAKGTLTAKSPGAAVGMRVFLNKPDANLKTSIEDIHYVSGLSLSNATDTHHPFSLVRNIGPVLQRLNVRKELHFDLPLTFTFVAVPNPSFENKAELGIQIEKIDIDLSPR